MLTMRDQREATSTLRARAWAYAVRLAALACATGLVALSCVPDPAFAYPDVAAPAFRASDLSTWSAHQLAAQMTFSGVRAKRPGRARAIASNGVGGIVLAGHGAPRDLSRHLDAVAAAAPNGILPFIASDEEGGAVQRMGHLIGRLASPRTMGRWSNARVRRTASHYGRHLKKLGTNMVFGPVADLDVKGSYMSHYDRCFSASPTVVARRAAAFASGLTSAGIIPVVKHWPGHGHARNSHAGASFAPPLTTLAASDMVPFDTMFGRGVPTVMVGHLQSRGLTETDTPASLSPRALAYLRARVGSDTVIITDSLSMAATTKAVGIRTTTACVRSIRAGADLALAATSNSPAVVEAIEAAILSGSIPRSQAEASVARILRLKARMGLAPAEMESIEP